MTNVIDHGNGNQSVRVVVANQSGDALGYTEGDTDATITGLPILWEDASDTLRAVSASKPLPVDGGQSVIAAASDATGSDTLFDSSITNAAEVLKASAGTLDGYHIVNTGAAGAWLQIFNVAAASVTLGVTAPKYPLYIPAGAVLDTPTVLPCVNFGTAMSYAATTTSTGSTAPATALQATFKFK